MDQQILFLINHTWAHPGLDRVMAVMSSLDFWWPFLIALGLIAAIFGGFRMRMMLVTTGLAIAMTDAVVVRTLKDFVGRPRPHEMLAGVRTLDLAIARPRFLALTMPLKEEYSVARIRPPRGSSFPSAHAANNFAVAAVCAVFFRRWGWLLFLPAVLVSYSRIYVGSHWPLDVVVSCLLGMGVGLLTVVAVEALWRRWGGSCVPRLHTRHPSLLVA
jgi:undecaprenyl-diphosphatase